MDTRVNNKVSTSNSLNVSSIWSKTIGLDAHAETETAEEQTLRLKSEELKKTQTEGLMELARSQNVAERAARTSGQTDDRDDFAKNMFWGLKGKKRRRQDETVLQVHEIVTEPSKSDDEEEEREMRELMELERERVKEIMGIVGGKKKTSSSSKKSKSKKSKKDKKQKKEKKKKKKRRRSDSDSSSGDSSIS